MPIGGLVILLFFLIGGFVLLNSVASDEKKVSMLGRQKNEDVFYEQAKRHNKYAVLNAMGSFNKPLLEKTGLWSSSKILLDRLDTDLRTEGFFFVKELAVSFAIALILLLNFSGPVALFPVILAVVMPDLILRSKISNREFLVTRTFPEIVDLMGLCFSAGLDFMSSMRWLTEGRFVFDNPFIDDLRKLKEEIALGKPRIEAMKDMAKRLDISEVSSLVRTLVIAEKMGVSVADTFERFSADVREKRFHRGERKARVASITILFPLIFLIMPVVGVVIMGPIVLKFNQGGFFGGM